MHGRSDERRPITGSFQWTPPRDKPDSEVSVDFGVAMSVRRVEEPARVTKPYTDQQWKRIDAWETCSKMNWTWKTYA